MIMSEEFSSIIEALTELQNDPSVPKNVKSGITQTIDALKQDADQSIRINKALNKLEELVEDSNMQAYTRTQIFNVVSLLEMI